MLRGEMRRNCALLNRVGRMDHTEKATFEKRLSGCLRVSYTEIPEGRALKAGASLPACVFKHFNSCLIPYRTIIILCIWNFLLIFQTHEAITISLICKSLLHTQRLLVITTAIKTPILQEWLLRLQEFKWNLLRLTELGSTAVTAFWELCAPFLYDHLNA